MPNNIPIFEYRKKLHYIQETVDTVPKACFAFIENNFLTYLTIYWSHGVKNRYFILENLEKQTNLNSEVENWLPSHPPQPQLLLAKTLHVITVGGGGDGVEPKPNDSKITNGRLYFCCFSVSDLQFRVAMQAEAAAQADTLRDQVRDLNARVRH